MTEETIKETARDRGETARDRGAAAPDELAIDTIRTLAMDAVQKANSGHPGTPMGLAPLGYVLYSQLMRHNPVNPRWPGRDRFILSCGHACMLQYACLHLCGYDLSLDDIKQFRQWQSRTPGHPEYGHTAGVEVSTGPLGQGFANSVGFALAEAHLAATFNRPAHEIVDHHVFTICSDGDMEEGIASEAASLAGYLGLGKLIAIYDDNKITIEGSTDLAFHDDVGKRFESYGWSVHELEINPPLEQITAALEEAKSVTDRPSLVVLPSHIGFGSPNKQDHASAHGAPLGVEEVALTKEALGWPYEEPFTVPDAVYELFAGVKERGIAAEAEWDERFEAYAAEHPDLAGELERIIRRGEPSLPALAEAPKFEAGGDPVATRSASGKALNWLAPAVPELIGGSADLAPSTATNLNDFPSVRRHDFGGRNLHFGIREHAMGAIVNAMTIEGLRAYGATFLVFSDYMRGAIRLAAIMDVPSIFVFTHDSIGVGEDGPTHQPVEQLAALRAMPSLDVIRPADANETALAWHWLLGGDRDPTALALSRQKLPILDRAAIPDDAIERGGYVLRDPDGGGPELILIGTGSEVSLCLEAADLLADEGVGARVVSMPSMERFAEQDEAYRDEVLPPRVTARVSVEAATTFGWERWVGDRGLAVGIDHYGASAPAADVFAGFGFTAEAVADRARELIGGGG
ncbi:MAG: transketolase [Solirubrobacterales bacterium]